MTTRLERFLSTTLTIAAVLIAAAMVRREFFPANRPVVLGGPGGPLEFDREWRSLLAHSIPEAPPAAPVVLIEFVDLECPACRGFHLNSLKAAREAFGAQLDIRFVHWPLSNHRFARPAAEAAECAGRQGRFVEFLDAVFGRQDSLGLKTWAAYARDAGVPDAVGFQSCVEIPTSIAARIDSGVATAERMRFFGTPTILVNGWRFPAPPSPARLNEVIGDLVAGREPKP